MTNQNSWRPNPRKVGDAIRLLLIIGIMPKAKRRSSTTLILEIIFQEEEWALVNSDKSGPDKLDHMLR